MSPGRTTSGFQGMTVVTVANFGVNSVTLPSWKRYQGGPFPVLRTTFTIEANLDVKSITKILDDPHIDEHITCMLHTTDTDGNDTDSTDTDRNAEALLTRNNARHVNPGKDLYRKTYLIPRWFETLSRATLYKSQFAEPSTLHYAAHASRATTR